MKRHLHGGVISHSITSMKCPKCQSPTGTPHKYLDCLPINMRKVLTPEQLMVKREKIMKNRRKLNTELNKGIKGTIRDLKKKIKENERQIDYNDRSILHSVRHQYNMSKFKIIADRLNEDVAGLIMRFVG